MDINRKFWYFSGDVFDKIYSQQRRITVYYTATIFLTALFSTKCFTKYSLNITVFDKLHEVSLKYDT